jgi:hypothetical protein
VIDVARAAFSQVEYRKTTPIVDAALRARDPLSTELSFKTLMTEQGEAYAFGIQIMALRREGLSDWKVSVKAGEYVIGLGDTIRLTALRLGEWRRLHREGD